LFADPLPYGNLRQTSSGRMRVDPGEIGRSLLSNACTFLVRAEATPPRPRSRRGAPPGYSRRKHFESVLCVPGLAPGFQIGMGCPASTVTDGSSLTAGIDLGPCSIRRPPRLAPRPGTPIHGGAVGSRPFFFQRIIFRRNRSRSPAALTPDLLAGRRSLTST